MEAGESNATWAELSDAEARLITAIAVVLTSRVKELVQARLAPRPSRVLGAAPLARDAVTPGSGSGGEEGGDDVHMEDAVSDNAAPGGDNTDAGLARRSIDSAGEAAATVVTRLRIHLIREALVLLVALAELVDLNAALIATGVNVAVLGSAHRLVHNLVHSELDGLKAAETLQSLLLKRMAGEETTAAAGGGGGRGGGKRGGARGRDSQN